MTRTIMALVALGLVVGAQSDVAAAQEPTAATAPEPKMPPMPSMEGQQGDDSKPVTQMPSRKKGAAAEKASEKKALIVEKKIPPKTTKPIDSRKGRR